MAQMTTPPASALVAGGVAGPIGQDVGAELTEAILIRRDRYAASNMQPDMTPRVLAHDDRPDDASRARQAPRRRLATADSDISLKIHR
jgi:hypothetical protein